MKEMNKNHNFVVADFAIQNCPILATDLVEEEALIIFCVTKGEH